MVSVISPGRRLSHRSVAPVVTSWNFSYLWFHLLPCGDRVLDVYSPGDSGRRDASKLPSSSTSWSRLSPSGSSFSMLRSRSPESGSRWAVLPPPQLPG